MRFKKTIVWIVSVISIFFVFESSASLFGNEDDAPLATVKNGDLKGKHVSVSLGVRGERLVKAFIGIPYAEPPTGQYRWKPPRAKGPWKEPLVVRDNCPACPQLPMIISPTPKNIREDCLYLNVWAPADVSPSEQLPVMVYIHGGGFSGGSGNLAIFNGSYLAAAGNVVVVTINYRLGPLGFLVFEGKDESLSGNYGMMDQKLALEWVRDNINAFGGNSENIILIGESAGAISVGFHMEHADSKFPSAIILESNSFSLPFQTPEEAAKLGKKLAKDLQCNSVIALRDKCYNEILEASQHVQICSLLWYGFKGLLSFGPVIDNVNFSCQPIDTEPGRPVLMGVNADEGILFAIMLRETMGLDSLDALSYRAAIGLLFGRRHDDRILKIYPSSDEEDNTFQLGKVINDYMFFGGNYYYQLKNKDKVDLYGYYFSHISSCNSNILTACIKRACHADELIYVFHALDISDCTPTEQEYLFSDRIISMWTRFAALKAPTAENPANKYWPPLKDGNKYLVLDIPMDTTAAETVARSHHFYFWKPIIDDLLERSFVKVPGKK